jgi:hypothetical protein
MYLSTLRRHATMISGRRDKTLGCTIKSTETGTRDLDQQPVGPDKSSTVSNPTCHWHVAPSMHHVFLSRRTKFWMKVQGLLLFLY